MIKRITAMSVVVAAAAVGLAGPANADLLAGTYEAKVVTAGMEIFPTKLWVFIPCGPDCLVREIEPPNAKTLVELRRQGNSWSGSAGGTTTTVDGASLVAQAGPLVFQLSRVG